MRQRIFFIGLFVTSVLVSLGYSVQFFGSHHTSLRELPYLVMLMIISILLQILAHLLRAYKSRYLLDRIRESKTSTLFKGLSVGYLFNSLLPFRLGEFIRAFYVGDALAISKTTVFMSILIERIADGVILGLSFVGAGIAIRSISYHGFVVISKLGIGLLAASCILAFVINIIRSENKWLLRAVYDSSGTFNNKISSRLRFMAWSAIYGTRLMLGDKRTICKYFIVSIVMWLVYFCSTAVIVIALFRNLAIASTWYATQSSYAAVSTPIGPGYIGTFYLIVSRLLHDIGIPSPGNFGILIWLILTIPVSLIGLFVLVRQRFNQTADVPHQEALINKLYREKDVSNEFANFLDAYFKGEEINRVMTQAELDGKFKLVRSFKGGSNAHTILVWQDEELVVKKITLPQFANKLKEQEHWLSERSHLPHLPRVLSQENTSSYYAFDLEYKADYLPMFDHIHSHSSADNLRVIQELLRFMEKHIYLPTPTPNGTEDLEKYIDGKILGKVNDTAAISNDISQLLLEPRLTINGTPYDNILQVVGKIRRNKKAMAELADYSESPIHGDLTVDNLIITQTGDFLVIDPNNENQVSSPVVDYGKLYQSLHSGYEFLIQLEGCQLKEDSINFEDSKSHKYAELFSLIDAKLRDRLDPKDYRAILFHEAVHYCRMLTYRATINPATLPVFYATAVKLFNEFLEQYA